MKQNVSTVDKACFMIDVFNDWIVLKGHNFDVKSQLNRNRNSSCAPFQISYNLKALPSLKWQQDSKP